MWRMTANSTWQLLLAGSLHLSLRYHWKDHLGAYWIGDPRGNDVANDSESTSPYQSTQNGRKRRDWCSLITKERGKHSELLFLSFSLNQVLGFWFHEFHYFYGLCCIFLLVNEWPLLAAAFLWLLSNVKLKSSPQFLPWLSSWSGWPGLYRPKQKVRCLWRWNSGEPAKALDFPVITVSKDLAALSEARVCRALLHHPTNKSPLAEHEGIVQNTVLQYLWSHVFGFFF